MTRPRDLSVYKKLLVEMKDGAFDAFLETLTDEEITDLLYDLEYQGRSKQQLPSGQWLTWLILSGRGFGKTWVGSKVVQHWAKSTPQIALVGADIGEVRDVMIDGPSGILKLARPDFKPKFNKVLCHLEYPNGAKVIGYSGDKPDSLRGPNNGKAWVDELFKFRYQADLWDELQMTMRGEVQPGDQPQVLITSTPRPTALCKKLVADKHTTVTTGSTYENDSLPKSYLETTIAKYEGTRKGRQELYGEILEDNPGALWRLIDIEKNRVKSFVEVDGKKQQLIETMDRVVIGVDPAGTSNEETSDHTGIIICGRKGDQGYVFGDESIIGTPNEWAQAVAKAFRDYDADRVVAEINFGGQMVEATIRNVDPLIPYKEVRSSRAKAIRAEPISALYEQGRVHHVGYLGELEDQMLNFNPELGRHQKSPDRLDAMVFAMTELFGDAFRVPRIINLGP